MRVFPLFFFPLQIGIKVRHGTMSQWERNISYKSVETVGLRVVQTVRLLFVVINICLHVSTRLHTPIELGI